MYKQKVTKIKLLSRNVSGEARRFSEGRAILKWIYTSTFSFYTTHPHSNLNIFYEGEISAIHWNHAKSMSRKSIYQDKYVMKFQITHRKEKLRVSIKASIWGKNSSCWRFATVIEGCCSNEIRFVLKFKALTMYNSYLRYSTNFQPFSLLVQWFNLVCLMTFGICFYFSWYFFFTKP